MITLTELMERRDKIFNAGDLPGATDDKLYECADDLSKRAVVYWNTQNELGITMDKAASTMQEAEIYLDYFLERVLEKEAERKENESE